MSCRDRMFKCSYSVLTSILVMLLICSAWSITAIADEGKTEYIIDELDLTVSIPDNAYVLSRDMERDDPALAAVGMDVNSVNLYLQDYDAYLDVISNTGSWEILFTMNHDSDTEAVWDFTLLSLSDVEEMIDSLRTEINGSTAYASASDLIVELSNIGNQPGLLSRMNIGSGELRIYETFVNGKFINIMMSIDDPVDREDAYDIIDSSVISVDKDTLLMKHLQNTGEDLINNGIDSAVDDAVEQVDLPEISEQNNDYEKRDKQSKIPSIVGGAFVQALSWAVIGIIGGGIAAIIGVNKKRKAGRQDNQEQNGNRTGMTIPGNNRSTEAQEALDYSIPSGVSKNGVTPVMDNTTINSWRCHRCGCEGNVGNFCGNCGEKRPTGSQKMGTKDGVVTNTQTDSFLDDVSFIQEMKHIEAGSWQQYDILLAAWGYGWNTMVEWAQYMADVDLKPVDTLTCALMPHSREIELVEQYRECGEKIADIPDLKEEDWSSLAVGGFSQSMQGAPVKIVWFNQTRVLRIFSLVRDETLMRRYAETVIRHTFNTEDAMKLAKPADGTLATQGGANAQE